MYIYICIYILYNTLFLFDKTKDTTPAQRTHKGIKASINVTRS